MKALAFSNNDIALLAWTYDRHLDGCLGFAIYRQDLGAGGAETVLPALARFAAMPKDATLTTADAPVQKFWWKDLGAQRGGHYRYRIQPLGGAPGKLKPLAGVDALVTNAVAVTHDRGLFKAYFNRGIVATQAVTRELAGKPNATALLARIAKASDPIRIRLMGELFAGVTSLLDRADLDRTTILAALYELNDEDGLEKRLQASDGRGDPKSRTVILGNEWTVDQATKEAIEDADAANRQALKDAKVAVIDRLVPKGQIPHNKFLVLEENGQPQAVLTGSTNWTSTGLATQTNNALVIESPAVAAQYKAYWQQLQADTKQAGGDPKALQSKALRTWNAEHNAAMAASPVRLEDGSATVEPLFSPNMPGLLGKNPKQPTDMGRVFELVGKAKQAVLFLCFDPGNNSILDAAAAALKANPALFVRGALTNAARAGNFAAALNGPGAGKLEPDKGPEVAVIADPGTLGKTGAKGKKPPPVEPDYRAIPANALTKDDTFGAWEKELYRVGFAIIHNKIVVIDPFSDDCVVITGSHNLGYRASHNNDENMVIVHGHRPLAEAYACHVLDLYDHYAWRYWLHKMPETFGKPLDETDGWQERYIKDADEKSPELRFWLSAVPSAAKDAPIAPAVARGRSPKAKQKRRTAVPSPRKVKAAKPRPMARAPAKTRGKARG